MFLFSFQMFGFGKLGNILKVTMFCRCVGSSFLYISHASYLCEWKVQKICCLLLQRNKWKFAYPKWWLCDCLPLTHFSIRTQILKTTKTPLFFYKKLKWILQRKNLPNFLNQNGRKFMWWLSSAQVLNVREDSKHCGIKCGWNECDFKATTKASLEVQIVISVIHSFKHALKLHTESKHLRTNYS